MALMVRNFDDPSQEWRRLCAEVFGTFFLVLVAAGGPMIDHSIPGSVGRAAAVVAPGLMVMAIILFMGKVSGAHLNPAVTLAFSLRRDFPWRRVPAYVVAQLAGALAAAWFLQAVVGRVGALRLELPGRRPPAAVRLPDGGRAHPRTGQRDPGDGLRGPAGGPVRGLGVGGYIALAGLWASPISGASMNPVRTFGPDIVSVDFTSWWVYLAGPLRRGGAGGRDGLLLRGPGGGTTGSLAAQGSIHPLITRPGKP